MTSPYADKPKKEWKAITQRLLEQYPLKPTEILDIATEAWTRLWDSQIGGQFRLSEVELPATVVGYFFQKLFAQELVIRYPTVWRGEKDKGDKDLVNLDNKLFSTEMKSSGQMKYAVYGNRSYNQQTQNDYDSSKKKSGYYITLNFVGDKMTLLRLGWIDQNDWYSQKAESGQAALLRPEVYEYKLVEIPGDYRLQSPVQLLPGVGPKTAAELNKHGIKTFGDIINYREDNKSILKIKKKNEDFLYSINTQNRGT